MTSELEVAAVDSLSEISRRAPSHGPPPGTPCANCATPLMGPWCHACGQAGEDFHRSMWRLAAEAFEGLFHLDGRVWATLPDLMLHPGRLTRAYLDGHRAPQIPPLRLFLVVLVAVFFAGSLGHQETMSIIRAKAGGHDRGISVGASDLEQMTPAERAQTKQVIAKNGVSLFGRQYPMLNSWFEKRMAQVLDDPARFKLVLEQWSERFAFLALPLAAGLLSLVFLFDRRFFVFDHTIFSLHSLSAVGSMLAVASLFSRLTHGDSYFILLAAPAHLFAHMRGVYGTSIPGTLTRMTVVLIGSALGAVAIFVGLFVVGLSGMGG